MSENKYISRDEAIMSYSVNASDKDLDKVTDAQVATAANRFKHVITSVMMVDYKDFMEDLFSSKEPVRREAKRVLLGVLAVINRDKDK